MIATIRHSVIPLLFLAGLTGCVQVTAERGMNLKKAVLHTPDGDIKLDLDQPTTIAYTYKNKYSFTINLFQSSFLTIGAQPHASIKIDDNNSYYQVNNETKQELLIRETARPYEYEYTPPPEMMIHRVRSSGGDLKNIKGRKLSREERTAIQKNTYHYYIPVTINGEDFALDITFKLDLGWSLQIGVPGGSP